MPRFFTAGDNALLVELDPEVSGAELAASADAVREIGEVESCIIGHSSLYVVFQMTRGGPMEELLRQALNDAPSRVPSAEPREHRIRVSVHPDVSPDLPLLIEATGESREAIIRRMRELRLTVRYCGFRPGFAYIEGLPFSWQLPRHSRARTSVPAGSFAVAGAMCAFYPDRSPGGWNLIGRTDALLWDPKRDRPGLLAAGDLVRIDPVEESLSPPELMQEPAAIEGELVGTFVTAGQNTMIVSALDPSRIAYGMAAGGPFDHDAAGAANHAVGNQRDAPVIECAMVGPAVRFLGPALLAWFGSPGQCLLNGRVARDPRQIAVKAGDVLEIGRITGGLRGVLALRGGVVDPNPALSVEPSRVRSGEQLFAGNVQGETARLGALSRTDRNFIRVGRGPHEIADELFGRLRARRWIVTEELNRIGVRLRCGEMTTGIPASLPSCGMQFGTVQLHPGGDLVVMGPDHPVTGGYLQPMTVLNEECWKLGQLMPGDEVTWIE